MSTVLEVADEFLARMQEPPPPPAGSWDEARRALSRADLASARAVLLRVLASGTRERYAALAKEKGVHPTADERYRKALDIQAAAVELDELLGLIWDADGWAEPDGLDTVLRRLPNMRPSSR